jgi:ribose/xylose/arabinose/galactoside ABC-type transport system permease subunit
MLVLRALNKLMIFSGLSGYLEGMFVGAILVLTLLLGSWRRRKPAAAAKAAAGKP